MELTPNDALPLLVLALPEESRPVLRRLVSTGRKLPKAIRRGPAGQEVILPGVRVLTTGMGERNARAACTEALAATRPPWVITGGIAGGLEPTLRTGDARYDADPDFPKLAAFHRLGLLPGRCLMVGRIAVTPADKSRLREQSGADLVDMESAAIRDVCRAHGISSATLRTVSDTAHEALPLDFGQLVDADQQLIWWKLAGAILASPGTIPKLLRLQRSVSFAAGRLAEHLAAVLAAEPV